MGRGFGRRLVFFEPFRGLRGRGWGRGKATLCESIRRSFVFLFSQFVLLTLDGWDHEEHEVLVCHLWCMSPVCVASVSSGFRLWLFCWICSGLVEKVLDRLGFWAIVNSWDQFCVQQFRTFAGVYAEGRYILLNWKRSQGLPPSYATEAFLLGNSDTDRCSYP
jgi:hypothetical protein